MESEPTKNKNVIVIIMALTCMDTHFANHHASPPPSIATSGSCRFLQCLNLNQNSPICMQDYPLTKHANAPVPASCGLRIS
jgi:hypothetical protein